MSHDSTSNDKSLKQISRLDMDTFDRLVRDTNEAVSLKILARFTVTLKESLEMIKSNLEKENSEEIRKACHKLIGSSELLGFIQFAKQARSLNDGIRHMSDIQFHEEEIINILHEGEVVLEEILGCFPDIKIYL